MFKISILYVYVFVIKLCKLLYNLNEHDNGPEKKIIYNFELKTIKMSCILKRQKV